MLDEGHGLPSADILGLLGIFEGLKSPRKTTFRGRCVFCRPSVEAGRFLHRAGFRFVIFKILIFNIIFVFVKY